MNPYDELFDKAHDPDCEPPWDFADEAYLDQADRIAELRELEGADQ